MSDDNATTKPTVQIHYCVPCGHLPRAMDVQRSILERFGQRVDGVKLKTGDGGVFVISIDDEVVYRKPEEFRLEAILEEVERRAPAA